MYQDIHMRFLIFEGDTYATVIINMETHVISEDSYKLEV